MIQVLMSLTTTTTVGNQKTFQSTTVVLLWFGQLNIIWSSNYTNLCIFNPKSACARVLCVKKCDF